MIHDTPTARAKAHMLRSTSATNSRLKFLDTVPMLHSKIEGSTWSATVLMLRTMRIRYLDMALSSHMMLANSSPSFIIRVNLRRALRRRRVAT